MERPGKSGEDHGDLHLAGIYRRTVGVTIDRVWENVFDWEHLDHLHEGSFAACELLEKYDCGWSVALKVHGRTDTQNIDMRADRARGLYVVRTLTGSGAGTEIHTTLTTTAPHETKIRVEFHLPESDPARLAELGDAFRASYTRLWDEDEAMMRHRQAALTSRKIPAPRDPVDLGSETNVRASLPLGFEFGGEPFQLIDIDGTLVAHSVVCPHWLGPLDALPVTEGEVRCPWHGYRFDVRSGRCTSGKKLRLAMAPAIMIVGGRVSARRPISKQDTE